jgi:DNA-binding HxlR family transcriptional regulator
MLVSFLLNEANNLWGKKWRRAIIWHLKDEPLRFSELKRIIPDCSVKMLSEALNEMEQDGLVIRKQYNSIPVKVTYELTADMREVAKSMVNYINILTQFYYTHRVRYNLPEHIIELLEKKQVPKK